MEIATQNLISCMEKRKRGKEVSVEEGEDDKFCLQNSFSIMSCIHNVDFLSVIFLLLCKKEKCSFFRYLFVPHSFFIFFLLFNSENVEKLYKKNLSCFPSKEWMKTSDEFRMQFWGKTNVLYGVHFGLIVEIMEIIS